MTGTTRRRDGASLSPPEGWLTLALVLLMCVTLAWAIDDARLVLGRTDATDFLTWAAVAGVLVGFLGPRVGWGRWTTYLFGSLFAALLVPLIVGGILALDSGDADPSLGLRFQLTADAAAGAFRDLVIIGDQTTVQIGHHLLVLGLWVWASSMFASYAVFGHRRPLNAVILIGALLVGNMAFTFQDQLVYLVIFTLASLFLLIRMHTFEEQSEWLRRRIGDPSTIAGLYLRGGTIFIGVTVLSALLLTRAASSAPLAGAWRDVGGRFIEWSQSVTRFLPQSGTGVALGPTFGSSATIQGSWFTSDSLALTIEILGNDLGYEPYWRTITYDRLTFDGFDTTRDDIVTVDRAAGEPLTEGTGDAVELEGRREVSYRITPESGGDIFAPQTPISVDVATEVQFLGEDQFFATANRDGGDGGYVVTSWVPVMGDETEGALTQNRLRSAGSDYPAGVLERYAVPNPERLIGPNVIAVRDEILQERPGNAFDLAAETVRYLQSDAFEYDNDINEDWGNCSSSRIECFSEYRRGFCQHYAALMTAIMRDQGYPARVVQGFLPGDRSLTERRETVRSNRAHAWVEVYFPGYGWVDFDPTGGSLGRQISVDQIPQGERQPSASPGASSSVPRLTRPPEATPSRGEPGGAGSTGGGTGGIVGPLIAVALLLAVIVGTLALLAWRRGPRGPVSADSAYAMVTTWASRFGFGPRPNQTVYEYAGTLAEILPDVKPQLETVANAKVEVAYGGRKLGLDRILSLKEAQRRLRTSLLRLALRRDLRRNRRR